eukprot:SAG31_NODE_1928_length_6883_cov_6.045106_5_plen_102_part_00
MDTDSLRGHNRRPPPFQGISTVPRHQLNAVNDAALQFDGDDHLELAFPFPSDDTHFSILVWLKQAEVDFEVAFVHIDKCTSEYGEGQCSPPTVVLFAKRGR